MGYSTDFDGSISVSPPLSQREIDYINKFAETRRMARKNGDYFVDGGGLMGQDHAADVIDYNMPPAEQPGLWCQWVVSDDGSIVWDGGEKFYAAAAWMEYIVAHFIGENPIAKQVDPTRFGFLQGHTCEGEIFASGEESDDLWKIEVRDNVVSRVDGHVSYDLHPVGASDEPIESDDERLAKLRGLIKAYRKSFDDQNGEKGASLGLRGDTFEIVLRDLEEAAGIR